MKRKLLIPFLLFYFNIAFSQTSNDKIIYLDSFGNQTNKTNYNYKRIIKDYYLEKDLYEVYEYYKSEKIKAIEITSDKNKIIPNGMCKHYYENGNIQSIHNYSKLVSANKEFEWYENGQKKSEIERSFNIYGNDYAFKILQFWDENGVQKIVDGNGEMEIEDDFTYQKGKFVNGHKSGRWDGIDRVNNFTYSEIYLEGKLIHGSSVDKNGISHVYTIISKEAKPKKSDFDFTMDMIYYSHKRLKNSEDDDQFVFFTISPDGKVVNIDTSTLKNERDKKKVIKLLSKYDEWNPALLRGIAISSTIGFSMLYDKS